MTAREMFESRSPLPEPPAVPGLYTVTISTDTQRFMRVYNASLDAAIGWLNFWYVEAIDGRLRSLDIRENGDFDHSPSIYRGPGNGEFSVQMWRSVGGRAVSGAFLTSPSHVRDLGAHLLRSRTKEDTGRVTRFTVTLVPKRVPVADVLKVLANAVAGVSDYAADPFHDRTLEEIIGEALPHARAILEGS